MSLDRSGPLDQPAHLAYLVLGELTAVLGHKVNGDLLVAVVREDQQDRWDHLECLVHRDHQDHVVRMERLGHRVHAVKLVLQVPADQQVQ